LLDFLDRAEPGQQRDVSDLPLFRWAAEVVPSVRPTRKSDAE
jgi:hypothetical protein